MSKKFLNDIQKQIANTKVELMDVNLLKPYEKNSRTHSEEQIQQIADSIKAVGFNSTITVDPDLVIIAGHGRLAAAKLVGMTHVPVVVLSHMTDAQRRAFIIADNRLALNAGWNNEFLAEELAFLQGEDFDIDVLGFDVDEIDSILEEEEEADDDSQTAGNAEDDHIPPVPVKPKSRLGDVWIMGNHRLMCGDSTRKNDITKLLNGHKIDMIFCDPPYGIDYDGGRGENVKDKKEYGKILNDDLKGERLGSLITQALKLKVPHAYYCVSPIMQGPFLNEIERQGQKEDAVIVWDKGQMGLGYMAYRRRWESIIYVRNVPFKQGDPSDADVWQVKKDNPKDYVHGNQKPVELIERALNNSSTKGQNVLDIFGGSGSTLIACHKLRRNAYLMELDPRFVDVIVNRWQEFTGKKAVLEGTKTTFDKVSNERD